MAFKSNSSWLILGDQLFDPEHLRKAAPKVNHVVMAEDMGLCTHFRYHQHKLVLFLSAMRHHRDALRREKYKVTYQELSKQTFAQVIGSFLEDSEVSEIHSFEVSDRFFETDLAAILKAHQVQWIRHESPGFLTPRPEFSAYLAGVKKPFMRTFYERQRRRLDLLMSKEGEPEGGQFSFDEENREKLPDEVEIPALPQVKHDSITQEVMKLVRDNFSSHPGKASEFWLPVTREGAHLWLKDFIEDRLREFGPYEDALSLRDPFLFHSVLTPFLNTGLLTPRDVVDQILSTRKKLKLPLNSVEGFIRQVIGWREFVFGVDRHYGEKQWGLNHWGNERKLTPHWYNGTTGLKPLDDVIGKLQRYGYSHHIERLMIVGNVMLTSEIHPHEAYRWFMEMYVDSADWVMGPNVFGMGIFSDGGIFATKPYLCGSNYWLKMGYPSKGEWCEIADGLYWSFIAKHQKSLIKNPRMATIARSLDRMGSERKQTIFRAAEQFKSKVTEC